MKIYAIALGKSPRHTKQKKQTTEQSQLCDPVYINACKTNYQFYGYINVCKWWTRKVRLEQAHWKQWCPLGRNQSWGAGGGGEANKEECYYLSLENMAKNMKPRAGVPVPAPPLTKCETWVTSLFLPWFPHLQNGDRDHT